MRQEDIEILQTQDESTLARWWCELNGWGWPEGLPDKENDVGKKWKPGGRRGQIMSWISSLIGAKACNREWNRERMTDEEHEAFWRGNHTEI
jgi:hypothetical protein